MSLVEILDNCTKYAVQAFWAILMLAWRSGQGKARQGSKAVGLATAKMHFEIVTLARLAEGKRTAEVCAWL